MTDAGFFKGTSTDQDSRFADKKKKLMKSMKFGDNLNQKVDTLKVNVETIKPWIIKRITELLGYEDEIVCEYVLNMLSEQFPDPKDIQINLTAFLGSKNARVFVTELWDLMISAMTTPGGAPAIFIEAKKAELLSSKSFEENFRQELSRATTMAIGSSAFSKSAQKPPARDDRRGRRRYTSSPENDRSERDRVPPAARHRETRDRYRGRSPSDYFHSSSRRRRSDGARRERRSRSRSKNEEAFRENRNLDGPICVPREGSGTPPIRASEVENTLASIVAQPTPDGAAPHGDTLSKSPSRFQNNLNAMEAPEHKHRRELNRRNRGINEYIEESSHPRIRSPGGYAEERSRRYSDHANNPDERRYRVVPHENVEKHRRQHYKSHDRSSNEREYAVVARRSHREMDDGTKHQCHPSAESTSYKERRHGVAQSYKRLGNNKRDNNADLWEEERSASRPQRERRHSPVGPSQQEEKMKTPMGIARSPEGPEPPHDHQKSTAQTKGVTKMQQSAKSQDKPHISSSSSSDSSIDSDSDTSSDSSSSDSEFSSSSASADVDNKAGRKRKLDKCRLSDKHDKPIKRPLSSLQQTILSSKKGKSDRSIEERHTSLPPEGPPLPDAIVLPPTEWQERGKTQHSHSVSPSSSSSSSDSSDQSSSSDPDSSSSSSSTSKSSEKEKSRNVVKPATIRKMQNYRLEDAVGIDGIRAENRERGCDWSAPRMNDGGEDGDEDRLRRQALESLKRRQHNGKDTSSAYNNGKGDGDKQ